MKNSYGLRVWTAVGVITGVVLAGSARARGAACTEVSTVWTLSSTFVDGTTASRIYGDGLGSYIDGTSGVTARIRSCSTDDAVLMPGSRQVMFNFGGSAFLGTSYQNPPSWTNGPAFASTPSTYKRGCGGSPCTVVNVRNILDGGAAPRDAYYVLYTRLDTAFIAPDNARYHLKMHNPATATVASDPDDAFVNEPFLNARVVVEHFPANYQGQGNREYWRAYPETPTMTNSGSPSPENGTLVSNDGSLNDGQFSIPFYLTIEVR